MKSIYMSRESALKMYYKSKPYLAVIFLQFGYAGLGIIAKFGLNHGMSHYTFAVYRNVVASVVFAPFALVLERKVRPRMTLSIFLKIMLLGLLELEKVDLRKLRSQAKVVGTLVTVGGAMIMTLVKGALIDLPWTHLETTYGAHGHGGHDQSTSHMASSSSSTQQHDPLKGALMMAAGCFCWAAFYILQAFTLKTYPAALSLTTLICMMGSLQGTVLTFAVEKGNTAIWALNWDTKLLAAVYGGIICSGVSYYVSGVLMKERGPVFVSAFNPLTMVIVAIIGSFMLAEQIFMGRVLGAMVIVIGLYLVIWGKSKDHEQLSLSDIDLQAQAQTRVQAQAQSSIQGSVKGVKVIPTEDAV